MGYETFIPGSWAAAEQQVNVGRHFNAGYGNAKNKSRHSVTVEWL
ncbi:MAG: hypothetical protein WCO26_04375 [Deltaproteobacteria bacterium]